MDNEIERAVSPKESDDENNKLKDPLRASDWASDLFWPLVAVRHSYQSLDIFGIGTH